MELKDRIDLFKDELKLILRKDIRDFVKICIQKVPEYVFYDCPSSSSGLYHPVDELAGDGTVIHTKKVFTVAYELCVALGCVNHRDEICAAALLHDLAKQGVDKNGHTVKNHPQIMAGIIADAYNTQFKDKISKRSANMIYWCVFHHYGLWTSDGDAKGLSEYSMEELCVYLADFISSKRFVRVDYIRKDGFGLIDVEQSENKYRQLSDLLNYVNVEDLYLKIEKLKQGDRCDKSLARYFKHMVK